MGTFVDIQEVTNTVACPMSIDVWAYSNEVDRINVYL